MAFAATLLSVEVPRTGCREYANERKKFERSADVDLAMAIKREIRKA
jgi:hypothetical protein